VTVGLLFWLWRFPGLLGSEQIFEETYRAKFQIQHRKGQVCDLRASVTDPSTSNLECLRTDLERIAGILIQMNWHIGTEIEAGATVLSSVVGILYCNVV
jgi:hypothetical protein